MVESERIFAHNPFGFSFHFVMKEVRLRVRSSTDFSIAGKKLSRVNFTNLGSQVKYVDTLKYYQSSCHRKKSHPEL